MSPSHGVVRLGALSLAALLCGCATVGCKPDQPGPGEPNAELVCDGDYLPALLDLVANAESRVLVTQFELFSGTSTSQVVTALGDAVDRGVTVKVLLDDEIESNAGAAQSLINRGVDAKTDLFPDTTVHSKMLIADGDDALVGSTNWSTSSISRNHECNLRLSNGAPVAWLEAWFDNVWANASERVLPPAQDTDGARVIALADDLLLPSLLESINGARQRVDFTLYGTFLQPNNLSSPAMQVYGALADAADRGVTVRGVAEWSDWQFDNNERNEAAVEWLEERGVDMRWETVEVITHAKAFLIDDTAQIQSANISTSGFERNREVGAWTDLSLPVQALEEWFDARWAESTDEAVARRGGGRR
ncbi:MAG: hypothetical protein KDA24_08920 [Deltaproteobacteria bacterium]|nr:hypothetical protein [Deltaproteobacteria bacterium]